MTMPILFKTTFTGTRSNPEATEVIYTACNVPNGMCRYDYIRFILRRDMEAVCATRRYREHETVPATFEELHSLIINTKSVL